MNARELKTRLEVVREKLAAEYAERDRCLVNDNEYLARHHDEQATALDLLAVTLQLQLEDLGA